MATIAETMARLPRLFSIPGDAGAPGVAAAHQPSGRARPHWTAVPPLAATQLAASTANVLAAQAEASKKYSTPTLVVGEKF